MVSEIILGLWKMIWFIAPIFGVMIVGAIYEQKTKRN